MRPPLEIPPTAEWLPSPKWIRAYAGGRKVVDSRRAMLLRQDGRPAFYYFPEADIAMDRLSAGNEKDDTLRYWHWQEGGQCVAWQLLARGNHPPELNGHLSFDWSAMDAWFEEDEEVFVHARDPRVRVETLHSRRHVRIVVLGETAAETDHPVLLFETGLPVRYYIPKLDVKAALLASYAEQIEVKADKLVLHVRWRYGEKPMRIDHIEMEIDWPELPESRRQAAQRAADMCTLHNTLAQPPEVITQINA